MNQTPDRLVELQGVTCDLGHGPVLTDIDLTVERGTFAGVVGPSGSGKTTLLRTLLGTVDPTKGEVLRREGLRIGYVPQTETIDWSFPVTVGEVLTMARPARRFRPWTDTIERATVSDLLDRLGLGGLQRRHIRALSGGQQQRVFLARAMLGSPDLLLLDEPMSGVDVGTRHELLHLLADLHAEGNTIVLTTHDLNGVATHLPRLVALNRTVVAAGPPAEVLVPEALEQTYGAPFEVLVHAGLRLVVDAPHGHTHGHSHAATHEGQGAT
ncbi:MAG: metal ABC transporter ATP-binding protein [Acidimicrobiales bacterium]|nr:metal ABC transporter ATP-binding protein [Acidimicrobiales bacterium]